MHVGVSCTGIALHRGNRQVKEHTWPNIVKVSYRKRKFRIKYREPHENPNENNPVLLEEFRCGEPPASKRLWKACVEQHTFFRSVISWYTDSGNPVCYYLLFVDWVNQSLPLGVHHCCYGEAQNSVTRVAGHWSRCVRQHTIAESSQSIGEWLGMSVLQPW